MHPSLLLLLLLSLIPLSSPQLQPPYSYLPPTGLTTTTIYQNITTLMSLNTCKTFSQLLQFSAIASDSFALNIFSGLTIFCPRDPALTPFLPQFHSLTFDAKLSLLLYHAVPTYYSISTMKSDNGVVNTLATGEESYNLTIRSDGDGVVVGTGASAARVVGTVVDAEPVGVYSIDGVLVPQELAKKGVVDGKKGGGVAAGPEGKVGDESGGGMVGRGIGFVVVGGFALFFV